MKRTLFTLVAAAAFAAVLPACRHTEIHERQPAVVTQPAPQPAPTVIEHDRPVIIEEHR